MNKKHILFLMNVFYLIGTTTALADFEFRGLKRSQIGKPNFEEMVLTGFGKDLPIQAVLEQIIGEKDKLILGNDVDKSLLLSWSGNRSRGDILNEVLKPLGLHWSFFDNTLYVQTTKEVTLETSLGKSMGHYITRQVVWIIPAGITLKNLLHQWGEEAGYAVQWRAKIDVQLSAAAKINGTFHDAIGQLMNALQDLKPSVKITFWEGNKVVVVETISEETGL